MPRADFFGVRQNGDSTGEGIVSDIIGLSFVYLMCLSFLHFYLFINIFSHAFYRIDSCITCIYFWKHTQASRLGGELAICPKTIGQGSDAWNTQLISECLLGNSGYTCLNYSLQRPILSLRRTSLGRYETLLRPDRKPTHVHIMNRTCP